MAGRSTHQLENLEDRYWLTPAGCQASGGHRVHPDGACATCVVCGANVDEDRGGV